MRFGAKGHIPQRFLACCLSLIGTAGFSQGEEYPAGTSQLTQTVDLQLQPVEVGIPDQFSQIPPMHSTCHPGSRSVSLPPKG